ncbi:hypothetical protein BH20ACI1_BH20ACI1_23350 [soil metagenome]
MSLAPEFLMSSQNFKNCLLEKKFLKNAKIGDIFSWNEVSEIHKVRNGIYQRNEQLISLLTDFGKINPCYPDFSGENENTIFYTGAGRRGDQKLDVHNRALFNAVESKHSVPLFNKLAVGRWEFLGFWQVIEGKYIFDEAQKRMIWKFTLFRNREVRFF